MTAAAASYAIGGGRPAVAAAPAASAPLPACKDQRRLPFSGGHDGCMLGSRQQATVWLDGWEEAAATTITKWLQQALLEQIPRFLCAPLLARIPPAVFGPTGKRCYCSPGKTRDTFLLLQQLTAVASTHSETYEVLAPLLQEPCSALDVSHSTFAW